jgi:hypothetical protein
METQFEKIFVEIFKNDDDVKFILANYFITGVNIVSMIERYYYDFKDNDNLQELIINSIKKDLAQ